MLKLVWRMIVAIPVFIRSLWMVNFLILSKQSRNIRKSSILVHNHQAEDDKNCWHKNTFIFFDGFPDVFYFCDSMADETKNCNQKKIDTKGYYYL